MSPLQFTQRPTSTPSLSSPSARNCLHSPWGGHLTHDHQLRHLLHTPEVRLGNTFWTKQMWAVVFYDLKFFVGWHIFGLIRKIFSAAAAKCMRGWSAEDQALLGLSRDVGGWGAGYKAAEGDRNPWLDHPVSSIYHPWWDIMLAIFNYMLYIGC